MAEGDAQPVVWVEIATAAGHQRKWMVPEGEPRSRVMRDVLGPPNVVIHPDDPTLLVWITAYWPRRSVTDTWVTESHDARLVRLADALGGPDDEKLPGEPYTYDVEGRPTCFVCGERVASDPDGPPHACAGWDEQMDAERGAP